MAKKLTEVLNQFFKFFTENQFWRYVAIITYVCFIQHLQLLPLLAGLQSPTPQTALACCDVLTLAVTRGWVESPLLVSALMTATVTTPHPTHTIHTLAQVLLHQTILLMSSGEDMKCPYSLRYTITPYY